MNESSKGRVHVSRKFHSKYITVMAKYNSIEVMFKECNLGVGNFSIINCPNHASIKIKKIPKMMNPGNPVNLVKIPVRTTKINPIKEKR
jgi:hypothetical protein